MSKRTYTAEQFFATFVEPDLSDGESSLAESGTSWEPVEHSDTLSENTDDEVVDPVVVKRSKARRPRPQVANVEELSDADSESDMEQSRRPSRSPRPSTSAASNSGDLASTSGLVSPGRMTQAAVRRGDVASPISAVQAGPVASRRGGRGGRRGRGGCGGRRGRGGCGGRRGRGGRGGRGGRLPTQPPRIPTQAHRAHSAVPELLTNPDWQPTTSAAHVIPPFTAQPGVQVETANLTPIDFFELFLTSDFVQFIVAQTNLYATQFIAANPNCPLARPFTWKPVLVSELKKFLGLLLNMGIVYQNTLRAYWSKKPNRHMPMYSATMTRNRFERILRFLHFNDNELCRPQDDPERDRLHKIRPLIDHLNQKFAELYTPDQNICVDESLIAFKGRLSMKQYIPSKCARYGVKVHKLCERATGYTYKFRVYEGKDSVVEPPDCPDYMGSCGKTVWDLVSPLFHKGYHLYVDNFYSSVPLFKHLFKLQIGCCGTVRSNRRGFPQRLVQKKLARGERACLRNDELLAVKWRDTRDVFVLSTIHPDTTVPIYSATGTVVKPLSVHKYNLYMGGVDFSDQMMAPYLIDRKSRRWYKKVSIYFIQLAIYNAFVLYKASGGGGSFSKFQESIILALVYQQAAVPQMPKPVVASRLQGRHYSHHIPGTRTKLHGQKKCRVCSKRGIRKETRVYCPRCPDKPGLCFGDCFELYHEQVRY